MDLSKRVAAGFALVIVIAGILIAIQTGTEEWLDLNPPKSMTPVFDEGEAQNFVKSDFNYISSKYRPYKEPLLIAVSDELKDSDWYLMFVKLNVTPPYGGDPHLGRTGHVRVDYDFKNLAGTAAFHILGLRGNSWITNRIEGFGSSALFVHGNSSPGNSMDLITEMDEYNDILVLPAGLRGDPEEIAPYSYYIHFDPAAGGLGALHITQDLSAVKGEMIYTGENSGYFYLTSSGGRSTDELLMLVAVDQKQPDTFSLWLDTEFIRARA